MKDEWIFKRPYDGDEKYSSVETQDERLICLLPEPHFMPDCGDTTWYNGNVESMKAIGKLISASPDMYEALKFLLNPSFGNDAWLLAKFPEAYSLCSKAIAKAEAK
jgi:hypothetical protein